MKNDLTSPRYWEQSYTDTLLEKHPKSSPIYQWIAANLPKAKGKQTSFEVGIYPGGFSTIFGDLGYEINGIDRIKEVTTLMKEWYHSLGYKSGDLYCADFFTHHSSKRYDVVASFGFIEHFKNFEHVLDMKAKMVKKGGYIIVEVPNFRGSIQFILKYFLDKKNLDLHYVPSMNFKKWEKVLKDNDFEVIQKDYLGKFSLKTYPQKRNLLQKLLLSILDRRKYFIKRRLFKGHSKYYSPLMILIAKKK